MASDLLALLSLCHYDALVMPAIRPSLGGRVLVVDDEPALIRALARVLRPLGLEVDSAADGLEARERIGSQRYDLCITDLCMPNADGFEVLRCANACRPPLPVVVLTGHGTVATAVQAMRAGAVNFLTKPFSIDEVEAVVLDLLARDQPAEAEDSSSPTASARPPLDVSHTAGSGGSAVFIGQDPKVRTLLELVERIADTDSTVLITGESGTGKEVLARLIHATSGRASKPFVGLNCAAVPDTLLESELFGHVRGAFTGAVGTRHGRFAVAEGGTLFLDEIGELTPALQAKLLRVLQEHEYSPVGESRVLRTDVRVIAATNADLEARVGTGAFRADLFYRLNVIGLEVPRLRERPGDIPHLAEHLLGRVCYRLRRRVEGYTAPTMACLCAYSWPGNVRELENVIERAVALRGEGLIEVSDLPPKVRGGLEAAPSGPASLPPTGLDLKHTLVEAEEHMILQALERTRGNKNRAAAMLGMNRTTLVEKLKRMRNRAPK
jgi:DNA-binding NtrC family response regulator